jgi:hypothetical protein
MEYSFKSFFVRRYDVNDIYVRGVVITKILESLFVEYRIATAEGTTMKLLTLTCIYKANDGGTNELVLSYEASTEYLLLLTKALDKTDPLNFMITSAHQRAKEEFEKRIKSTRFNQLSFPILNNVDTTVESIKTALYSA